MFSGLATAVEAAALTALYALVVQAFIHRDLSLRATCCAPSAECVTVIGGVLIILGVAVGLTNYLVGRAGADEAARVGARATSRRGWSFLLVLNVFLLAVGWLMEIFAAIVVVVPLIVPLGAAFGIHPVHLGIIFIANLELGFLTPLVGLNIFLASYRFKRPVLEVCVAALPMMAILGARRAGDHLRAVADDRPAHAARTVKRAATIAVTLAVQFAVAAVLSEGILLAMYHHPSRWYPAGVRRFLSFEYFYRRHIVSMDQRTARYNPELLYTLRPGAFTFSNVEFSTPFIVNSLGVRDREQALAAPEIVVVGDSYAMGWGVQQDEAFPKVIERRTGRRVLNAAVPSYGTVREMLMLDRIDMSRSTTLVVQYCSNDFGENDDFFRNGNRHVPSSRDGWIAAGEQQQRDAAYRPFRTIYDAAVWIKRGIEGRKRGGFEPGLQPPAVAAERFLNVLTHASHPNLNRMRIIVTDMDPDPAFIRAVDHQRRSDRYPAWVRNLQVIDLSAQLTADRFYVMDDHLTARGHAVIADALVAALPHGR